ncbi:MAG TPA: flippase, partial [Deltaproteobacteria bacterium]|nr:flippase [Deltaproteobacteria bacterium]
MKTAKRIFKNAFVLLSAHVVSKILAFLYIMYAARYLQASGFGVLSFALALAGMFGVLADIGLQSLMIRELARESAQVKKYLSNVSCIKILLSAAVMMIMMLTVHLLGYPSNTVQVVLFIGLYVILGSFTEMIYSVFRACEQMELVSLGIILKDVLLFSGIVYAIANRFSIVGIAVIYTVSGAAVLFYALSVLNIRVLKPGSRWLPWIMGLNLRFWKITVRKALPFGLSAFFVMLYFWVDSVMLSFMKGNEVVGLYNAAYRIVLVFTLIPAAIVNALFPVISRYFKTSYENLISIYENSFKYLLLMGLPVGVGVTFLADMIIPLIFGSSYNPAVPVLEILIWAGVLMFPTTLFGTVLASIDRQNLGMYAVGFCALINIVLNMILIPRYSYLGAAYATVITEVVGFALQYWFLSKHLHAINLPRTV